MKKTLIVIFFALGLIIVGALAYNIWPINTAYAPTQNINDSNTNTDVSKSDSSPANTSYIIDNKKIELVNGQASQPATDNSASQVVTKIFETSTEVDLDMDSRKDSAVILTQDSGGSGIFYYVAVALNTEDGYVGTNAILLGDRISPQNINFKENIIIVNYADRNSDEPMTAPATIAKSKYLAIENGQLIEIPNQKEDIVLDYPAVASVVSSPLTVRGKARGTWYFEASFPIMIVDWDGKIIGQGIATAQDDWMTEDFVDFEGEITFDQPEYGSRGALILKKDNPSGLPENDDALEVPIFFK